MTAVLALGKLVLRMLGLQAELPTDSGTQDLAVLTRTLLLSQDQTDILVVYTTYLRVVLIFFFLLSQRAWPIVLLLALGAQLLWRRRRGHEQDAPLRRWRSLRCFSPLVLVLAGGTFVFSYILDLVPVLGSAALRNTSGLAGSRTYEVLVQDGRAGDLRPVVFVLWFGAAMIITQRYVRSLHRWVGWILEPVGRTPLYAYLLQIPVVAALRVVPIEHGLLVNTFLGVLAAAGLWLAVRLRVLARVLPA